MNEHIKNIIKDYIQNKSVHSLFCMLNQHKLNFENEIIETTSFLGKDADFNERVYCILNDITSRPICQYCKKNYRNFGSLNKGYHKSCSVSCGLLLRYSDSKKLEESNKKRNETKIKKYGDKIICMVNFSELVKKGFEKEKEKYDKIKDLYTNKEINELLNSEKFFYKKYIRKRKCKKIKKR